MDTTTTGETGNLVVMLIVWAIIIVALYFFMIRPQSKKRKEEEAMRSNLEIGDEIVTIGGIVGRVVSINDDTDSMVIETGADRTKVRLKKWALSTVETNKDDKNIKEEKTSKK